MIMAQATLILDAMPLMIRRIEEMFERHLENLGHLERIRFERERRMYRAHHGRNPESRSREINRQTSKNFYVRGIDSDFFVRFTQRRHLGGKIRGLHPPTGERDLPRVVVQMVGTASQQHPDAVAVNNQRQQYRRRNRSGAFRAYIANVCFTGKHLGSRIGFEKAF